MRCSACTGVFSPATGHQWTAQTRLCLSCARHWMEWLKKHLNRRWGGLKFYDHAATATIAPIT